MQKIEENVWVYARTSELVLLGALELLQVVLDLGPQRGVELQRLQYMQRGNIGFKTSIMMLSNATPVTSSTSFLWFFTRDTRNSIRVP